MADKVQGVNWLPGELEALQTQFANGGANPADFGMGADNVLASGIDSLRGAVAGNAAIAAQLTGAPLKLTVTPNAASGASTTTPQAIDRATAADTVATSGWQTFLGAWFVRAVVIILGFIFVAVGLGLFKVPMVQAPAIR